ncbi:MAG: nuclear transport factor 2 family protein [Alphaproteobacteria bacterium]
MTPKIIVENFYACIHSGDLAGVLNLLSADIEWELVGPKSIPYFDTYSGKEGVENFFLRLFNAEEIQDFAPLEIIVENSVVVVFGHETCKSKSSGRVFSAEWVHRFEIRDGVIAKWKEIIDTARVNEAYL